MSDQGAWTCPACETVNGGVPTCVLCGGTRPAPAPVAGASTSTARVPVVQQPVPAAPTAPPPEPPAAGVPSGPAGSGADRRGPLIAAVAVLVVLLVGGAFFLGTRSGGGGSSDASSADASGDLTDGTAGDPAGADAGAATSPPTIDTRTTTATVPATSPAPEPAGPTGGLPLTGRTFVAMLLTTTDQAHAESEAAKVDGGYAFYTSSWASLRPDKWVVAVGQFATADDALGYCRDHGLVQSHDCVALPVSQDPSDIGYRPSIENPSGR